MNQHTFTIFLGNNKTMNLKAIYEDSLDPLDLTACTEIDVALPNADGTFTHLLLTNGDVEIVSPAVLGKFNAHISSVNSALLNPGMAQNFFATFTFSGLKETVKFSQALNVLEG